ncbi:hypothetical protein QUF76_09820 [Desulfobacterales bacterium HSG16]|nr:hypothetical protein [Desulfobacterales bacterium HSG16]
MKEKAIDGVIVLHWAYLIVGGTTDRQRPEIEHEKNPPVPLKQARGIKPKHTANVNFPGTGQMLAGEPVKGQVRQVVAMIHSASDTLKVRVEVANPTHRPAGERPIRRYKMRRKRNLDHCQLYTNPDAEDYHLNPGSPCIDTGSPEYTDKDNSRSDMGVYGSTLENLIIPDPEVVESSSMSVSVDGSEADLAVYDKEERECSKDI